MVEEMQRELQGQEGYIVDEKQRELKGLEGDMEMM